MAKVTPFNPTNTGTNSSISLWLQEVVAAAAIPKKRLARLALGHSSAAYLSQVLKGETTPTAVTVRKITYAIGLPAYLVDVALARCGYIREVLDYMFALQRVGMIFCKSAGVEFDPIRGVRNAWVYGTSAGRLTPKHPRKLLSQQLFFVKPVPKVLNPVQFARILVMPRPIAVAIDIAVLGFPRRGDVMPQRYIDAIAQTLERGYARFWSYDSAKKILKEAKERFVLPRLLRDARRILGASYVPSSARRNIAAEFIQIWADSVCPTYAKAAREQYYVQIGETDRISTEWPLGLKRLHSFLFPPQEQRRTS